MMSKRFTSLILMAVVCTLGLQACNQPDKIGRSGELRPTVFYQPGGNRDDDSDDDDVRSEAAEVVPERQPASTVSRGSGRFIKHGPASDPASGFDPTWSETDTVSFNFIDAPVEEVVSAVLSGLNVPHSIAPGISGTISIIVPEPLDPWAAIATLEEALRINGAALINKGAQGFAIVPLDQAASVASGVRVRGVPGVNQPGFAIEVVELKHISSASFEQVLSDFNLSEAVLRSDPARNLIIIAGTSQIRQKITGFAALFDAPWLEGMSFALIELAYAPPSQVASELTAIFAPEGSPVADTLRIIPIPRLSALLIFTPELRTLNDVRVWVDRLDQTGPTTGRKIYVYAVQNGRAADLAASLNSVIAGSMSSQTSDAAAGSSDGPVNGAVGETSSGGLKVVPNEENNSLLVYATEREYDIVLAALGKLDVLPRQVLIEAALAEVTLSDSLRYGVQWFFEFGNNRITLSSVATGAVASAFPGFSYLFSGPSSVGAVLNALDSVTDIRVLASPKMMVLNNHTASLTIGDQVPIITRSAVGVTDPSAPIVNSVELRDTGVLLTVTPRINDGGLVILEIAQEVSDVAETTSSGIDSPTISQRKMSSTLAVRDGETIALGGLIRENSSTGDSGIPGLKDVPIIGNAFKSNTLTRRKTELIVLITTRVVEDSAETRDLMEYLRNQFGRLIAPAPSADTPPQGTSRFPSEDGAQ